MNASQCSIFHDLSRSYEYHALTTIKGVLCTVGAVRIALQWRQYGVRFLVHENTKISFRFILALNIIIAALFGAIHLFEVIRGFGLSIIYASQHVMLLLSLERLYSAIFPAHFERQSSCFLTTLLASIAIIGTFTYGMLQVSNGFQLFHKPLIHRAFLNMNIPENKLGFDNLVSKMALSNSISLLTLCMDFYINYVRKRKISPSLAVSYQASGMIENRRIVLTLIPIELAQTVLGLFTGVTLSIYSKTVPSPVPIRQQVFHELVTLSVCFPIILTILIKHSAEKNLNRPRPTDPEIDHFDELRKSWETTVKY